MILSARELEVKVSAPEYHAEEWNVWRGDRSDAQLRIEYQAYIYKKYADFIPLRFIQVSGDYKTAA